MRLVTSVECSVDKRSFNSSDKLSLAQGQKRGAGIVVFLPTAAAAQCGQTS